MAVDHQVAESGHALAMEHRRHQPALTMPERALAGQQAVAEQAAQHRVVDVVLVVVAMIVVQDVADVVGMGEQKGAGGGEAEAYDVAVLAKPGAHKLQRLALHLAQAAEQEMAPRSRAAWRWQAAGAAPAAFADSFRQFAGRLVRRHFAVSPPGGLIFILSSRIFGYSAAVTGIKPTVPLRRLSGANRPGFP